MSQKVYPNHDPHCVIYQLGENHCNCKQLDNDIEFVDDPIDQSYDCPDCGGLGQFDDSTPCRTCDGEGEIDS